MGNLIIKGKGGAGNKLIIQDQAGAAVLTTADSGASVANVTLEGTTTFPGKLQTLKNLSGTDTSITPTARVWRDSGASDDSAVSQISSSAPYSWHRKIDNEYDPYGIISLASNAVTITNTGKYVINWHAGGHFRSGYQYTELIDFTNSSAVLACSNQGYVEASSSDRASGAMSAYYVGEIAASTVLRVYTLSSQNNTYWWGNYNPRIYVQMTIQLIGT